MESKHGSEESKSPTEYTETHRGFALRLEQRPATNRTGLEFKAIGAGAGVTWESSWRLSWAAALFDVRALVDRYQDAREACERIRQRRELAHGARGWSAGAVELVTRRPAVKS